MTTLPLVIGVGNRYRGDDGVGLAVVRALRAGNLARARFLESDGDCTVLLETWQDANTVILIDAVASQSEPGRISRFDVHAQNIPTSCVFSSTHAFGIAETLALACVLGQLPPHLIVYGIEGENFTSGEKLSLAVRKAIPKVVRQVILDISREVEGRLCAVRDPTPPD